MVEIPTRNLKPPSQSALWSRKIPPAAEKPGPSSTSINIDLNKMPLWSNQTYKHLTPELPMKSTKSITCFFRMRQNSLKSICRPDKITNMQKAIAPIPQQPQGMNKDTTTWDINKRRSAPKLECNQSEVSCEKKLLYRLAIQIVAIHVWHVDNPSAHAKSFPRGGHTENKHVEKHDGDETRIQL